MGIGKNIKMKVILTPDRPSKVWDRVVNDFIKSISKGGKRLEASGLRRIREVTPVRFGTTRDSWSSSSKIKDFKFTITIRNPLARAEFLNTGTQPSPGRFVPVLGRRLITPQPGFGMHPGIRGTRYIDNTAREIEREGITDTLPRIKKDLKRSMKKHYPKRRRTR